MATPTDRRYTKEHEWILPTKGGNAQVGLTALAQQSLGDIVFVELPNAGDKFDSGESFGTVESVKAVSELYAPVAGQVVAVNEDLNDSPENINEDAYSAWLIELRMSSPKELDSLMTAQEYDAYIAEASD